MEKAQERLKMSFKILLKSTSVKKKKKVNVIIILCPNYDYYNYTPDDAWICLNKQDSKYARIHNLPDILHSLRSL